MNSKNPEQEPLSPEPRSDAKSSEGNSWSREDAIIHALLRGYDDLYKNLGGSFGVGTKGTSFVAEGSLDKASEKKAGKKTREAWSAQEKAGDARKDENDMFGRDTGDEDEENDEEGDEDDDESEDVYGEGGGYLPDLNAAKSEEAKEKDPSYYRSVAKNTFESLLFRVLEKEYPQFRISIKEPAPAEKQEAMQNYFEIRVKSDKYRGFIDVLLRRENLVLHGIEELLRNPQSRSYCQLLEQLEAEKRVPESFTKRFVEFAASLRQNSSAETGDPMLSEELRMEILGVVRGEIDAELKKYRAGEAKK